MALASEHRELAGLMHKLSYEEDVTREKEKIRKDMT